MLHLIPIALHDDQSWSSFNKVSSRENLEFELMCPLHVGARKRRENRIVMINKETSFLALLAHNMRMTQRQFRMSEQRRYAWGNSRQLENFTSVNDSNPSTNDMAKVWRRRERAASSHMVIYRVNLCIARTDWGWQETNVEVCVCSIDTWLIVGSIIHFSASICATRPHPIWITSCAIQLQDRVIKIPQSLSVWKSLEMFSSSRSKEWKLQSLRSVLDHSSGSINFYRSSSSSFPSFVPQFAHRVSDDRNLWSSSSSSSFAPRPQADSSMMIVESSWSRFWWSNFNLFPSRENTKKISRVH